MGIEQIANDADGIFNGFAFKRIGSNFKVFNLYSGHGALIDEKLNMIESSMDNDEYASMQGAFNKIRPFLDDNYAQVLRF